MIRAAFHLFSRDVSVVSRSRTAVVLSVSARSTGGREVAVRMSSSSVDLVVYP